MCSSLCLFTELTNLFAYTCTVIEPPTNIRATVLTPRSVEVTWEESSSTNVTGYLISYSTTASYASGGNVTVDGGNSTSHIITSLEENTLYIIMVQAIKYGAISSKSNEVSITTYTDCKWYTL